jgi:hypothetical protein
LHLLEEFLPGVENPIVRNSKKLQVNTCFWQSEVKCFKDVDRIGKFWTV